MTDVVIGGVGESAVGEVPDLDALTMAGYASRAAVADAGLEMGEIDGLFSLDAVADPYRMHSVVLSEMLGIQAATSMTCSLGGASFGAMVLLARDVIRAGRANAVLIVSADKLRTGMERDKALSGLAAGAGHPDVELPYAPLIASAYALVARRHMHEFGTTLEDLAHVAVAIRRHGAQNPSAQLRSEITLEEAMESRIISSPLRAVDCSLVSDGGGALVVARSGALPASANPVPILGGGEMHRHEHVSAASSLTALSAVESARAAFEEAGVTPASVDLGLIYDSFTITVLMLLEALGFCEQGKGGEFVRETGIGLDGGLPVNPHGGLLAHAHPGRPGGIFHIIEAVRQLRGEAVGRQVRGASLAVVHGCGGIMSTNATLVLGA